MSAMVERVARAIASKAMGREWDLYPERQKQHWLIQAHAAIEAMREPTERVEAKVAAMLSMADPDERGLPEGETMKSFYGRLARVACRAMIDAALAERSEAATTDG